MKTKQSLSGKTLFVGIDVYKTTYSDCIVCESEIVGKASMLSPEEGGRTVKLSRYLWRKTGEQKGSGLSW